VANPFSSVGQVNRVLLRPFQQEVDLLTVALVLALLLVVSGLWHITLERIEL
jgi:hypothetical protein